MKRQTPRRFLRRTVVVKPCKVSVPGMDMTPAMLVGMSLGAAAAKLSSDLPPGYVVQSITALARWRPNNRVNPARPRRLGTLVIRRSHPPLTLP